MTALHSVHGCCIVHVSVICFAFVDRMYAQLRPQCHAEVALDNKQCAPYGTHHNLTFVTESLV